MTGVMIADLKNNLSRHLVRVREGMEVVVLDRHQPIARIIPYAPRTGAQDRAGETPSPDVAWAEHHLDDLDRQGLIARGDAAAVSAWATGVRPLKLPKRAPRAVDLLLKARRASTR